MNPLIFREYDIRGLADTDLPDEIVERIGRAYGTYARQHGVLTVMVGRDVRLSSERIANTVSNGIRASGCSVIDLGMVPTPVFYFSFFQFDISAGLMITASHNPAEFNGFKVGLNKTTIFGEEIQRFRELVESGTFLSGTGDYARIDPIPAYIRMLQHKVKFERSLKVVFDPGNGTSGPLLGELLRAFPVEPHFINVEPDGRFPNHLPDPTIPKYMKDVTRLVRELDADLGIGLDGDADRIGAIDDQGNMVYGDRLLALFSGEILTRKPGSSVVFEVKCSQGLVDYVNQHGGKPVMWKTGHSLIKAKMKELHAEIAGEMSGHMFFADGYYGYDDAIYASLRLMKLVADSGRPLSELAATVPAYFSTPEIRVDCPDEIKFQVVKSLQDYFRKEYDVIDIDGVRAVFPDGWGLVRASNTQPVLVLRFEARTQERLSAIRDIFYAQLKRFPEVRLPAE
jgi:phosphomannomutase/phosphoglucomutase